jgi:pyruvate ferredoxin oxidoreductase delta subunit
VSGKEVKGWKEIPIAGIAWIPSDRYISGDWRTSRPVVDQEKCNRCLFCYIFCPDSSIQWSGEDIEIDYEHCKGCGICAVECPKKAIEMVLE